MINVILRGTRLWFDCNSLILFLEVRSDYRRGCNFYNRSPTHFKIDLNAVICMILFIFSLIMESWLLRNVRFYRSFLQFYVLSLLIRVLGFTKKKYCIEINQLIYSVVFHVTIHQPIAMLHLSGYNCFEKGCIVNGEMLTRQCRRSLWVMVVA